MRGEVADRPRPAWYRPERVRHLLAALLRQDLLDLIVRPAKCFDDRVK
jgi:hypothetical protein